MAVLLVLPGCATSEFTSSRRFNFERDTFAYTNQLVWEYYFDIKGNWVHKRREPKPDYTHHCFVVVRAARQFFQHAQFDPTQPQATPQTYRELVRKVVGRDPSRPLAPEDRVMIPGYFDLREFSAFNEDLLQQECGGAWRSYFQRGHWRIMFPFPRTHQERVAHGFLKDISHNKPAVAHLVKFPQLTINHAVLVFDAREAAGQIEFLAYDPNRNDSPVSLWFDKSAKTFRFSTTDYWPGGTLDVYEIYRNLVY